MGHSIYTFLEVARNWRGGAFHRVPGSQQKFNPHEADSCFGKVVEGFEDVVMDRITQMNGGFGGGLGFIKDGNKKVKIKSMQILVPDGGGDSSGDNSGSNYVPWIPNSENFGYTGFEKVN